jgi:hypothetical protein
MDKPGDRRKNAILDSKRFSCSTIISLEVLMRTIKLTWILAILLAASVAYGQLNEAEYFPYKDLIFPQVVAGGEYQTYLTVTNRGTEAWDGTLQFYTGTGEAWNPYVNAAQISEGSLSASIPSKTTRTYKVTLPGSAESGYLIARKNNSSLNNCLQGHLTYYISSGEQISDSIGVLPSNPFSAATIPFEDFNSICLAFANTNVDGDSATISLKLYSDTNRLLGTYTLPPLLEKQQVAMYLYQMFEAVAPERGRVEIEVNVPVSGMALIQVASGQYSSIPLDSTYRHYHINLSEPSEFVFKELTLWTDGLFVNGYMTVAPPPTKDEPANEGTDAIFAVTGEFRNNKINLHFDGNSAYTFDHLLLGYLVSVGEIWPSSTHWAGMFYAALPIEDQGVSMSFTATLVP